LDLAHDGVRAVGLRDRIRLVGQGQRVVMSALPGGDIGQADQVSRHAGQVAVLPAQPRRLLQTIPRRIQLPGGMLGDAQVPQRLGHRRFVTGQDRQF
jgi:hypothetical protein